MGRDSASLELYLNAHHYLFEAGDYEQAGDIVYAATEYLHRWGQIELLLRLLTGSVRTLSGHSQAVVRGNLATVYQGLGDYQTARRVSEQVLAEFQTLGDRAGVSTGLHQLGMLHYLQGEHGRARERYEESLAIAQALGDRAGVARSLGQLGLLFEVEGDFAQAVRYMVQALVLFNELGTPERDIASSELARLRGKMGEEAFEAALPEAHSAIAIAQEEAGEPERLMAAFIGNTVSVLTDAPDKKGEWLEALTGLQAQAQAAGADEWAAFAGALRQLVEGEAPEALTQNVPPAFQAAWAQVLQALSLRSR